MQPPPSPLVQSREGCKAVQVAQHEQTHPPPPAHIGGGVEVGVVLLAEERDGGSSKCPVSPKGSPSSKTA